VNKNEVAIIIAFYLSKFDKQALHNLGFATDSAAFESIAGKLGIKKNYIKFRRDEFDPVHPWRKGWQRPMDKRIINAIEALQDLSESELREIVLSILNNDSYKETEEIEKITFLIHEYKGSKKVKNYVLRGPTGKKAEEYFIEHYKNNHLPIEGDLVDTRELGSGYDFKIICVGREYYLEVKGLSELEGGILFTGKEWETAKVKGDNYFLIIITGVSNIPKVNFIQNPAGKLSAKRNIIRSIQINWTITNTEIGNVLSK
jgi:hypothetical protein